MFSTNNLKGTHFINENFIDLKEIFSFEIFKEHFNLFK